MYEFVISNYNKIKRTEIMFLLWLSMQADCVIVDYLTYAGSVCIRKYNVVISGVY